MLPTAQDWVLVWEHCCGFVAGSSKLPAASRRCVLLILSRASERNVGRC